MRKFRRKKISRNMKNDQRDPADRANCRQHQATYQHESGVRSERRGRQSNGERGEEKCKPRWIFRRRDNLTKVRPAISEYPAQRRKHYGVDEPRDSERANQQQGRYDPDRRKGEDRARFIQFRLNVLEYVLPHHVR